MEIRIPVNGKEPDVQQPTLNGYKQHGILRAALNVNVKDRAQYLKEHRLWV